jgi:hypothetical protein
MPWVGFELTIPGSERAKTVHALDRSANVTGNNNIMSIIIMSKKAVPCNRLWRPIGLWDVEAPTFSKQSAHSWRWGCQPYAPDSLYPQESSWYSFQLEAESGTGPQCGWKDYVNWKIQWHRESNPHLSGLQHSASTNYATTCTHLHLVPI